MKPDAMKIFENEDVVVASASNLHEFVGDHVCHSTFRLDYGGTSALITRGCLFLSASTRVFTV